MRFFRRLVGGNLRCVLLAFGMLGATCGAEARAEDAAAVPAGADLLAGKDLKKHWTTTGNWILDDAGVVTLKPRPGEKTGELAAMNRFRSDHPSRLRAGHTSVMQDESQNHSQHHISRQVAQAGLSDKPLEHGGRFAENDHRELFH